MVTDRRGMLHRIHLTALVIGFSLFPPCPDNAGYNRKVAAEPSAGEMVVSVDNVRFYLADIKRALNPQGELKLLFPGCFVLAAPLILFRLKREGFSDCRALMTADGLFISAMR